MAYKFHPDKTLPTQAEIFVFGSNTAGRHGLGAALVAKEKFGARYGVGSGPTGSSYAIPTKDGALRVRQIADIKKDVGDFIEYAAKNPSIDFFITRIGCGLAGYKDGDIAPLFVGAPDNCIFPIEWKNWL